MSIDTHEIADRITAQITRVSAKRERLTRQAQAAGLMGQLQPTLSLMDRAMHFAREAREERCPVAMIAWLRALEDFKDSP